MKKILSVLLTVLIALCVCTINVVAQEDETFTVTLTETGVEVPNVEYFYNGHPQTGIKENDYYSVSTTEGQTNEATNHGEYEVTLSLKDPDNYPWSDGTTDDKVVTWKIKKREISIIANYQKDVKDEDPSPAEMSKHVIAQHGDIVKGHVITISDYYREKGNVVGHKYKVWIVNEGITIKDSNGVDVTENYVITVRDDEPGTFEITLTQQPTIEVDNAIGYINSNGDAEFFVKNFEDYEGMTFEYSTTRDASRASFKPIECQTYTSNGETYHYFKFHNSYLYGSKTYHVRAKGDATHEPSNTIALEVRKSSLNLGLSDAKICQGHAGGKASFGLSLSCNLGLSSSNAEESRDYVIITADNKVLKEGEQYTVDIDLRINKDLSLNVFTITLNDDYANTLAVGKHDIGFHIVSHAAEIFGESFVPHATLTVQKATSLAVANPATSTIATSGAISGVDTPSSLLAHNEVASKPSIIKIVSTGVE